MDLQLFLMKDSNQDEEREEELEEADTSQEESGMDQSHTLNEKLLLLMENDLTGKRVRSEIQLIKQNNFN